MGDLDGKVAIVTGGASGIGLASATRMAAAGASVVVVDLDEERGNAAAEGLGGIFARADVSRPEEWESLVELVERTYGGLDVAHLNAGVTTGEGDVSRMTVEQYRRILGANVDGVVFGIRAVVPAMARRQGGAIVATASLAGLIAFAGDPVYTLTKYAVVGLVRSLPQQLSPLGIRVNAVCPGLVDTPLIDGLARDTLEGAGFPLIDPDEVAAAVLGCVLGDSTGQAVVVQVGLEPVAYRFGGAPGPRLPGSEGVLPPGIFAAHDQAPAGGGPG